MRSTAIPRSFVVAGALAMATVIVDHLGPASAAPSSILAQRGEYLTRPAGQCTDCHGATLHGGPAPPVPPGVPSAKHAPSLAGLTMFKTDADAIRFLSTTLLPNGKHALPPMPRYQFAREDATAIVAYLRSTK